MKKFAPMLFLLFLLFLGLLGSFIPSINFLMEKFIATWGLVAAPILISIAYVCRKYEYEVGEAIFGLLTIVMIMLYLLS